MNLRGKHAVVTGGYGFIGLHLCRLLSASGATFSVLDAGTRAAINADEVRSLPGFAGEAIGFAEYSGPWQDLPACDLAPTWVVFHLAAESHVDASIEAPVRCIQSNAVGTARAAEHAREAGAVLLYCSTDEVYGDAADLGYCASGTEEDEPLHPSSPYSAGKAAGEHVVTAYARTYGLRAVITRGSNAFGPGQLDEKLVPKAARAVAEGVPVPLHGGGLQIRQWVHVEEFAEALLLAAAHRVARLDLANVFVYNIAGPDRLMVKDLVAKLHAGRGPGGVPAPDRPGQDMSYHVSGEKAWLDLGFRPRRRISDPEELESLLAQYGAPPVR